MVALTQIVLSISVFPDGCERFIHVIHNMQHCLIIHVVIPGNAFYKSRTASQQRERERATHETLMLLFLWAYTFILIVSHISINVTYFLLF